MTFQYIYFIARKYMKGLASHMAYRDDEDGKLNKTTSFRLSEEMLAKINALRNREGTNKDKIIRRLISYGFILQEEMDGRAREIAKEIASRGSPAQSNKGPR